MDLVILDQKRRVYYCCQGERCVQYRGRTHCLNSTLPWRTTICSATICWRRSELVLVVSKILEFWEKRDLKSRNEGSGRLENELLRPQNELSNLKGGCHKQPPHHTIKRSPTSGKSTQPPTTRGFPSPMIILLDTADICPWMSFHLCLKRGRRTETRLTHGSRPKIQLWWFEKRQ